MTAALIVLFKLWLLASGIVVIYVTISDANEAKRRREEDRKRYGSHKGQRVIDNILKRL
jgi:uncharacterized protein (UPF0333 family)